MVVSLAEVATTQMVEQGRTCLAVIALVGGLDENKSSSELFGD